MWEKWGAVLRSALWTTCHKKVVKITSLCMVSPLLFLRKSHIIVQLFACRQCIWGLFVLAKWEDLKAPPPQLFSYLTDIPSIWSLKHFEGGLLENIPTNSFALCVAKAKAIWPKTWWKWGHASSLDCTLLCPHYVLENGEARGRNIFSSPQHGHEVFKM